MLGKKRVWLGHVWLTPADSWISPCLEIVGVKGCWTSGNTFGKWKSGRSTLFWTIQMLTWGVCISVYLVVLVTHLSKGIHETKIYFISHQIWGLGIGIPRTYPCVLPCGRSGVLHKCRVCRMVHEQRDSHRQRSYSATIIFLSDTCSPEVFWKG